MERRARGRASWVEAARRPSEAERLGLEPGERRRRRRAGPDGRRTPVVLSRDVAARTRRSRARPTSCGPCARRLGLRGARAATSGIVDPARRRVASARSSADRSRRRSCSACRAASCCCTCGRSTTARTARRCSPRTSTTWPTRSSSRSSGGVPGGGTRDDEVGKAMRLKRVIDPAGVSVICALDHGMTSPTFLEPLADIATRAAETVAGGANVIMMCEGHDPDRRAGVLADHVAGAAAVGVARTPTATGPRSCRSPRSRRRSRSAPTPSCCSRRSAARREAGMIRHPRGGRPRVRRARHAVHRRGRVPHHVRVGRGAEASSTASSTSAGTCACAPSSAPTS